MRKHAIVDNNIVTEVLDLDEELYKKEASYHELIVDIEDTLPQPDIGWVLVGNQLVPPASPLTGDERRAIQQTTQRLFGQKLAPKVIDLMGARNLKLAEEGTPVDVASLASQLSSVKLLLETGALKTARTICILQKPNFSNHEDIFQIVIDEVTNFLNTNGY